MPHSERVRSGFETELIGGVSSQASGALDGEMVPGRGSGASRRVVILVIALGAGYTGVFML